ncbi:Uncharacterised protein [uncultured archaeon]|nr:Uncharacterised protein [uncultured archaeon]
MSIKPLKKLGQEKKEEIEIEVKKKRTFEKFHGKLELDEKTADEIIEIQVWDNPVLRKSE